MFDKNEAISLLNEDFEKNICLLECLKHDLSVEVLYIGGGAVALKNGDGIYFVSAPQGFSDRKGILAAADGAKVVLCTDRELSLVLQDSLGIASFKATYQAFYADCQKIDENTQITIDKMLPDDYNIRAVVDNYRRHMTYDEVKTAILKRGMFAAYLDGEMAGFIGFHSELSIGMLEVFPAYRMRGVGSALLRRAINASLSAGITPFCHIVTDNFKSVAMCKKVGLSFYRAPVYWLG